jgi:ankyrin repeat protein
MNCLRAFIWLYAAMFAPIMARGADDARLADATERNDSAAVSALLKEGAAVDAAQPDGMTALHWAVYHDNLELARALIAAGADATTSTRYGVRPLNIACTNGNEAIVEMLLAAGADSNGTLPGGETALMTAARTGRIGPLRLLLARGAETNTREDRGQTAMMWAAAEGHDEVVEALLAAGADPHVALPSGFTALFFAAREGRTDVAKRILAAGLDVNEPLRPIDDSADVGPSPLTLAVINGHFESAVALLEAGADPNDQSPGYAPLHAITWVRKPIRGDGDPPPMGSGKLTSVDCVRRLVTHGADINIRLSEGESGRGRFKTTGATPFVLAARASDVALMKLLLELGANSELPNADHTSPLLAAAGVGALGDGDEAAGTEAEAVEAVRLLLDLGADVNAVDDHGETAMHGAAYQSRPAVVELLVERGADVSVWNRPNEWGWTPLQIAQGHRPGNFRPAPDTIAGIEGALRAVGAKPPANGAERTDGMP